MCTAFLNYAMVITHIRTTYDQETLMDRANVSKFGHKGRANCLCILPKTIYLRKTVVLDDFAI